MLDVIAPADRLQVWCVGQTGAVLNFQLWCVLPESERLLRNTMMSRDYAEVLSASWSSHQPRGDDDCFFWKTKNKKTTKNVISQ